MDTAIRRQTLADLLRRSAKRFPGKLAIQCGATRWTFAEFDDVVDRLEAGQSPEEIESALPDLGAEAGGGDDEDT